VRGEQSTAYFSQVVNADGFHILSERFEIESDTQGVFKVSEEIVSELISRVGRESSINIRLQEWDRLYNSLKEGLGDWNLYHQVFDPTQDNKAIFGSLSDDITACSRSATQRS
jgi:hypothetical protein